MDFTIAEKIAISLFEVLSVICLVQKMKNHFRDEGREYLKTAECSISSIMISLAISVVIAIWIWC